MHGGTLTVCSAGPGRGSTFTVRLPMCTATATAAPAPGPGPAVQPPVATAPAPPAAGCCVLVADDLREAAQSLAQLLEALGHEVHVAFDGAQALALAERHIPDVALLDLGMPVQDGYETCRRIRAQPWGKATVLIAQTGWGQPMDRQRTQDAGFDHHLVKPITLAALTDLLARAPASGRPGAGLSGTAAQA